MGTHEGPKLLAQAMTKAGTVDDTEKIAQTLRQGEWDTISGKARFVGAKTFRAAAVLQQLILVSRLENGKIGTYARMQGTMP